MRQSLTEWVASLEAGNQSGQGLYLNLVPFGLEFPVVLIPGIGFMPHEYNTPEEEARLLYVAMTRGIDQLIMTCDRPSEFTSRLETALGKVAVI